MPCIKTGAHAYLEEYDEWVYGDMHSYANPAGVAFPPFYVFRVSQQMRTPHFPIKHFTIHKVLADWKDQPYGTILSSNVTNHGYEGVPV